MKKNSILFGLISILCVGAAAGCGGESEPTYNILAELSNLENGTIKGGGRYKNGDAVTLRLYPTEGCHTDSPKLYFTPEGGGAETEYTASTSEDGTHFMFQFTVNNGEDGGASTVGSYKAAFSCLTNKEEDVGAAGTRAEFLVNYKVVKNFDSTANEYKSVYDDGSGGPIIPTQSVVYGNKITEIKYIDSIDGKIEWYIATNDETDTDGLVFSGSTITNAKYDFTKPVQGPVNLIGVVVASSPEQIVLDSINNFKASKYLSINNSYGKGIINNLSEIANKKMYFESNNLIIDKNTYYQVAPNNRYYKLPLADPSAASGFKVSDIKEVKDYIELNDLDLAEYTISKKMEGGTQKKETVEFLKSVSGASYDTSANTATIGSFAYTIDSGKIMKDTTEVGTKTGDYLIFGSNAGDLSGEKYKVDGTSIKLVDATFECKVYELKDSEDNLYMEVYIHNGYIYKTVRKDGFTNVIEYPTTSSSTTLSSGVFDMNLLNLISNDNAALSTELAKVNEKFETILKNVPVEAKSLKTLIDESAELSAILRMYDYTIEDPLASGDKKVDLSKVFPWSSDNNSVKNLDVKVNASYSTIDTIINSLRNGGFTVTTSTTVFETETVTKTQDIAAGTNVLGSLPAGINAIIAKTLTKLNTLGTDYNSFKFLVEDEGTATEKNIYSFYANQNDSVAYIIVTLDKDGNLSQITYTDLENDNINERNTYISTFDFPPAS